MLSQKVGLDHRCDPAKLSVVPRPDAVALQLLKWFAQNARDLPWRRTTDPYAIWISEIMLQQTQVQTVIPYWERWMQQLPDVKALATAKFERVLKLWEGLGYYTRARNLHRAAQLLLEQHLGAVPQSHTELQGLPGIGAYTAGAICSIAFNQPTPILDGNVTRVLARLYGVHQNVKAPRTKARLWLKAQELITAAASARRVRGRRCAMFNQALMELGATVCRPKQPSCSVCPVAELCEARQNGCTESLPNLGPRPGSTPRRFIAFIVHRDHRFAARQRPAGTVNACLWEFPNIEVSDPVAPLKHLAFACLGATPTAFQQLCVVRHTITRFRIQLEAYHTDLADASSIPQLKTARWCTVRELHELALPSAHRRILAAIERSDLRLHAPILPNKIPIA
jgi:A/G-specific adenine glycosylase